MSFAALPLPAPSSATSSIWSRRMITKSVPTSETEVGLNVLSLLLDVPLASLDEQDLASSPVSLHSPSSPWGASPAAPPASAGFEMARSSSPFSPAPIQRSKSMDCFNNNNPDHLEMHTAQTAVKAALDVLEEPTLSRGLRISTSTAAQGGLGRGCLTAPLSPASPISPAESCFSSEGEGKKKGRARMSQEKRKRLARRREREALVAALTQPSQGLLTQHHRNCNEEQLFSHSAPVTPIRNSFPTHPHNGFAGFPFSTSPGYEAFSTPISSPRSAMFDLPSPALTSATVSSSFGSIGTPSSSPTSLAPLGGEASSPPTLVVQPPSPQRIRIVANRTIKPPTSSPITTTGGCGLWNTNLASVY